jgi:tetratricopeptide (TPR) repeat protein
MHSVARYFGFSVWSLAAFAALTVAHMSHSALAQPKQPPATPAPAPPATGAKDPSALAFQFAEAAGEALRNGDYDTAIDLFEKANAKVPHPIFQFDIGQAHRKIAVEARGQNMDRSASHRKAAIEKYQAFLATKPVGKEADIAQDWLTKLNQQQAEDFPKEEAARIAREKKIHDDAVSAEQARIAEETRIKKERDALEAKRIAGAVGTTKVTGERRRATIIKIAGASAFGLGAVATGAGVYFGLKAKSISDDLTKTDTFDNSRIAQGDQAQKKMYIAYAAGGALIVGGAVTYFLGYRMGKSTEQSAPAVNVTIGPLSDGGATFVVGGGF